MTTMTDTAPRVTGGVDTHKDTHLAAALDELGRVLATAMFAATPAGYRQLLRWMRGFVEVVAVGVEGTGSWGAGLARSLTAQRVSVIEVTRPNRQHRRRHGRQQRHRMNRGGDRQANCALYIIVMSRLRWHHPTKTYMARRVAEGRTTKEVIRCLKRYVAIEVHRAITADLGRTRIARPSQIAA